MHWNMCLLFYVAAYVCFIMGFNAICFLVILVCYMCMFVSIRASHSWNSKDTVVAKRMALLVFTDFFCWAPIIFFSITAAFGWESARISLDEAKVLTIFVLPLNSCANPFLYAFFTRQFKRDCVKLCKRIEESSYTRHLSSTGNGRSSHNNNRQNQSRTGRSKRESCDQVASEQSTSGEPSTSSNPTSEDSDLTIRKVRLTTEEKQIMRYVRAASGNSPRKPLLLASDRGFDNDPAKHVTLVPFKRTTCISPQTSPVEDESESSPDIILHTADGNVYLGASPKSQSVVRRKMPSNVKTFKRKGNVNKCAQRLCNHTRNSGYALQHAGHSGRSVQSQTMDSDDKIIQEEPDDHHSVNHLSDKAVTRRFEVERSKELGLNTTRFLNANKPIAAVEENKVCKTTIATQTEFLLPESQLYHIQKAIAKREKDKHINEWRKTSHLSFLWRNSGTFDGVTHKHKSNSLVELTRPVASSQNDSTKRHSLTLKQEGYILLKNSSRDSAYEDDDIYEFYDNRPSGITAQDRVNNKQKKIVAYQNSVFAGNAELEDKVGKGAAAADVAEETNMLLSDNLCLPKHRNSCDIESGISSSS